MVEIASNRIRSCSQRRLQSIVIYVCRRWFVSQVDLFKDYLIHLTGYSIICLVFPNDSEFVVPYFCRELASLRTLRKNISEKCLSLMHGNNALFISQSWVNYAQLKKWLFSERSRIRAARVAWKSYWSLISGTCSR